MLRSEVLTAWKMWVMVFWPVTPCSLETGDNTTAQPKDHNRQTGLALHWTV